MHIKHNDTLREYQKEFEKLASRVHDWTEKVLVGAFIGGLKSELAAKVRVYHPKTYLEMAEVECLRDDHLAAVNKGTQIEPCKIGTQTFKGTSSGTNNLGNMNPQTTNPGVKRLSWEEIQKRREKGLCFNCDEKFVPRHKCMVTQAFLLNP